VFDFCPHCGQTIEQEQIEGRMLVCEQCGKDIGFVGAVERAPVSETEELIRGGTVARCPVCGQAVELKGQTRVPHYGADTRKICPGSGKPAAADAATTAPAGKDLSAFMTRDVIKLISCKRTADPRIEILTLDYLDKSERVRIQIEALREMLGPAFRMKDYPPSLHKPHLAVWGSADVCVVAKKHDRGGFESIADADIAAVLADMRHHREKFFA
jgi:DNA-directed RNA polymerase subunit RPC12/RpoP